MVAGSRNLVTAASLRLSWTASRNQPTTMAVIAGGSRLHRSRDRPHPCHFSGTQFGTVFPAFFFVPICSYPSQHGSADFFDTFFLDAVRFLAPDSFRTDFFAEVTVTSRKRAAQRRGINSDARRALAT